MIHFDVTQDDGDRELKVEDTDILVGWIEQGRKMTSLKKNWTEWRFTPAGTGTPAPPVRDNISAAYSDARAYAATLLPQS